MEEMEKTTPEIKPKKKKTMVTAIILRQHRTEK